MKITEIKDWLQVIAIVVGAIWAIWTFGLKTEREDIVYRGKAIAAVPSCTLSVVGRSRGFYILKARSSVVSTSKIKVHVFHSPYVFLGIFAAPLDKVVPLKQFTDEVNERMLAPDKFAYAQQYAPPTGVPIEMGRLWSTATHLEPNERIETETLFLVSDRNAQVFDWVTYSFALVLAEDISRLGLQVSFDNLGNLSGQYLVYEGSKKNRFDLVGEPNAPHKTVGVKADGSFSDAHEAQQLNAATTSAKCNAILPPKQLSEPMK